MKKIAGVGLGEGTNLEAILEAAERGQISAQVVLVISGPEEGPSFGAGPPPGHRGPPSRPPPLPGAGRI